MTRWDADKNITDGCLIQDEASYMDDYDELPKEMRVFIANHAFRLCPACAYGVSVEDFIMELEEGGVRCNVPHLKRPTKYKYTWRNPVPTVKGR